MLYIISLISHNDYSESLKVNGGKVLSHCAAVQDNVIYELNGGTIKVYCVVIQSHS